MAWKYEARYELHFFPILGELERWQIYVSTDEKTGRKVLKDVVSQWKWGGIITLDAIAIKADSIEAIVLVKVS